MTLFEMNFSKHANIKLHQKYKTVNLYRTVFKISKLNIKPFLQSENTAALWHCNLKGLSSGTFVNN